MIGLPRILAIGLALLPALAAAQATPTPSLSRALTPAAEVDATGTRDDPFPVYTLVPLSDDWVIAVIEVTPDATARIQAADPAQAPPAPGTQYVMARIRATYEGGGANALHARYRLRAIGESGTIYSTFNNSCGTVPDRIPNDELTAGETMEGNICWAVKSDDVEGLIMFDQSWSFDEGDQVFLALTPEDLPEG